MDQFEINEEVPIDPDQLDDDDDLGIVTSLVDLNDLLKDEEHVKQLIETRDYMSLFMKGLLTQRKLIAPIIANMNFEGYSENDKLFFKAFTENLEEKQNQFNKMKADYEALLEVNRGLRLEQQTLKAEDLESRTRAEKAEKLLNDEKEITLQHSLEINKKTKEIEQFQEIQKFLEEQRVDLKNAIKYLSETVVPAYEKAQGQNKKDVQGHLATITDQQLKIRELETRYGALQYQAKQDADRLKELQQRLTEATQNTQNGKWDQIRKMSSENIQLEQIFDQETKILEEKERKIQELSENLERQREAFMKDMNDRNTELDEKLESHMSQVESLQRQQQNLRDASKRQSLVITKQSPSSYEWVSFILVGIGLRQLILMMLF